MKYTKMDFNAWFGKLVVAIYEENMIAYNLLDGFWNTSVP